MFAATDGVNTHRGAIFGLGLLCAAAGVAHATPDRLGNIVRKRWGASIDPPLPQDESHGALVQRRYGACGARAEAASGFSAIYQIGWPALRTGRLLAPADDNAACVQCCFALIATVADTNLLYRGGLDGLRFCRQLAGAFIRRGGVGCADWTAHAVNAHRTFVARALSPGGCADLLAMTLFVDAFQAASNRVLQRSTRETALV
jgi:triphosphoribosyl-dephospho-CoA synthase